jgi:TRAP-type uncharacterized transport system substrate-binding protein
MRRVIVRAGELPSLDHDVETVGGTTVLICRKDIDEELAYQLTSGLFGALPDLARAVAPAELVDEEEFPTTPIPLHAGAARFYRERQISH